MARLRTRINSKGYTEYQDPNTGEWKLTHKQVAKRKYGDAAEGKVIHHINGVKEDNRRRNLAHVTPSIHGRLHANEDNAHNICFRCGREGHWATDCPYKTDYKGKRIKE